MGDEPLSERNLHSRKDHTQPAWNFWGSPILGTEGYLDFTRWERLLPGPVEQLGWVVQKPKSWLWEADGDTHHCCPGWGGGTVHVWQCPPPISPLLGKAKDWQALLEDTLQFLNLSISVNPLRLTPIHIVKSQPPVPQKVTAFGFRAFKKVKLKGGCLDGT